jgi:hypothetical protein
VCSSNATFEHIVGYKTRTIIVVRFQFGLIGHCGRTGQPNPVIVIVFSNIFLIEFVYLWKREKRDDTITGQYVKCMVVGLFFKNELHPFWNSCRPVLRHIGTEVCIDHRFVPF